MNEIKPVLKFLSEPIPQAVLWTAVLAVVIAIAMFVMKKFRDQSDEDEPVASELLTNFEEMHRGGGLSDAEYRTIKTALGAKLQEQLRDSENRG